MSSNEMLKINFKVAISPNAFEVREGVETIYFEGESDIDLRKLNFLRHMKIDIYANTILVLIKESLKKYFKSNENNLTEKSEECLKPDLTMVMRSEVKEESRFKELDENSTVNELGGYGHIFVYYILVGNADGDENKMTETS